MPEKKRKIKAIDLFAGVGGSSLGAVQAGVKIVAAIDVWDLAEKTFLDNFQLVKFYKKRCEALSPKKVRREIGAVNLLIASPECTSHTCAKGNASRSETSRRTAFQVIRFAKAFKPRWIVVENVIHMRSWKRYKPWLENLERLGYKCRVQVLNAADFGAPQSRRRLFVMCDRQRLPDLVTRSVSKRIAARTFVVRNGHYPFSTLRTERRAKSTIERAERAIRKLGRRKSFLLVYYGSDGSGGWQSLSQPLRTITTVDRFAYVHKGRTGRYEMRMLQVPELQHAMGFPSDYKLKHGTRRDRIRLLGNAVCPQVMRAAICNLTSKSIGSCSN